MTNETRQIKVKRKKKKVLSHKQNRKQKHQTSKLLVGNFLK